MIRTSTYLACWLALTPVAAAETSRVQLLRAGCSGDAEQIETVGAQDLVEVQQALAGEDLPCFRITLKRGERTWSGYVTGEELPAVAEYVRRQGQYRDSSFVAQQAQPAPTEAAAQPQEPRAAQAGPALATFDDFTGKDSTGKPVSLSGLGGQLTLVTFWSPDSPKSKQQLLKVMPLYNVYKAAGLRAIGISADPNPKHIATALDDIRVGWPQMADGSGLAQRYGANAAAGTTLVLDASHHIVGSGLSQAELEKKVRQLLSAR